MAQSKAAILSSFQPHQIPLYHNYINDLNHQSTPKQEEFKREGPYRYSAVTDIEAQIFSSHALRISSYNSQLTSFAKFSVLQLALDGFFNTQRGNEIKCFSCGLLVHLETEQWNPLEIHRRAKKCQHILGEDKSNVTFGSVKPGSDAAIEFHQSRPEVSDEVREESEIHRAVRTVYPEGSRDALRNTEPQSRIPVARDVTPARTTRHVQRQVAILDYRLEICRLQSFRNWPSNAALMPEDLANAGFYYMGTDDRVQCVFCRGILRSWEPDDRALAEHLRHFPQCPFLENPQSVGNVPLGEEDEGVFSTIVMRGNEDHDLVSRPIPGVHLERPTHPEYAQVSQRLHTFTDFPSNAFQKPEELIRAGFYYTGEVDAVRCFFCNTSLRNWKPDHDPWVQHVKASRSCGYIRMSKGEKFIEDILKHNKNPEKSRFTQQRKLRRKALTGTNHKVRTEDVNEIMRTSLVRSVQEMDIASEETVRKVVIRRLKQLGNPFPNPESLIEGISEFSDDSFESDSDDNQQTSSPQDAGNSASKQIERPQTDIRNDPDLPDDEESLRSMNEKLQEERLCKVCLDEAATIVFLKCGHLVCCSNCAPAMTKCPVCRQNIVGTIRADI